MSLFISNFKNPDFSRRNFALCALLTAALWYFSLRESGLFALGWIAPLPLFYALSFVPDAKTRRRRAYFAGWFCYALLNAWIFPTILRGGSAISVSPPIAALLGVVAVVLIGAIHGAQLWLVGWMFDADSRLAKRAIWLLPISAAALWTAFDVLRTTGPLAHGWGALAFSQWRDYALLQNAAFIGQHGITFLCVWCAASLALWARRGDAILWRAPLLVFLTLHLFGAWRLASAQESPEKLRVLLIQTNASSADKSRGDVAVSFNRALALTQKNARAGQFDLIVWPETTFEVRGLDAPRFASREAAHSREKTVAPRNVSTRNLAVRNDRVRNASAQNVAAQNAFAQHLVVRNVAAQNVAGSVSGSSDFLSTPFARHAALSDESKSDESKKIAAPRVSHPAAAREYSQKVEAMSQIFFAKDAAPAVSQLVDFSAERKREGLPSSVEPQQSADSPDSATEADGTAHGDAVVQFSREGEGGAQLRALVDAARRLKTRFLCGALLYTKDGHLFNAAVLIDEAGRIQVSAKERLVPFGERAPFGEMLPLLRRFSPPSEIEIGRSVVMNLPPADARYSAASTRARSTRPSTSRSAFSPRAVARETATSPREIPQIEKPRADLASFQDGANASRILTVDEIRRRTARVSKRNGIVEARAAESFSPHARVENRAAFYTQFATSTNRASTRGGRAETGGLLRVQQNDFEATPRAESASTRGVKFGALICFESCFVSPASALRRDGAQALFVLTNDQWFSGTGAPWQHAAMAAMRAAENGVAVAQAGNGGYSFCVDRQGRFVIKSSLDTESAVAVSVPVAAAAR